MGLLTDTDLLKIIVDNKNAILENDKLLIRPFTPDSLTLVGYDLRIGDVYSSKKSGKYYNLKENQKLKIRKGDTIIIRTLERIEMPKNLNISGLISSKVSIVTQGISHISTTIDADWKGHLLVTISNISNETIELRHGDEFCTAVFFKNVSIPTNSSEHEESRNDIFLRDWTKKNRKALIRNNFIGYALLLLIPISTYLGWKIFGNAEGMSAFVAAGVALTILLKEKI